MKTLIIVLIAVTISCSTFAETDKSGAVTTQIDTTNNVNYTCTMHPDVTIDKSGKCHKRNGIGKKK